MKFWRDRLPESCRLKSYILETFVHGNIGSPESYAAAVLNVFEGVERTYGIYRDLNIVPTIVDPGYTAVNVAKHWQAKDFTDFLKQIKIASETARKAFDSASEGESRKLWRQVFGSKFGQ